MIPTVECSRRIRLVARGAGVVARDKLRVRWIARNVRNDRTLYTCHVRARVAHKEVLMVDATGQTEVEHGHRLPGMRDVYVRLDRAVKRRAEVAVEAPVFLHTFVFLSSV